MTRGEPCYVDGRISQPRQGKLLVQRCLRKPMRILLGHTVMDAHLHQLAENPPGGVGRDGMPCLRQSRCPHLCDGHRRSVAGRLEQGGDGSLAVVPRHLCARWALRRSHARPQSRSAPWAVLPQLSFTVRSAPAASSAPTASALPAIRRHCQPRARIQGRRRTCCGGQRERCLTPVVLGADLVSQTQRVDS